MKRNDECLLGERLATTKDKLVKRQRNEIQMRGGRPYFPVCVFLAGEKAFAHFEELRDKLKLFWPAYLDVLRFFYIDDFTIADFTDMHCCSHAGMIRSYPQLNALCKIVWKT